MPFHRNFAKIDQSVTTDEKKLKLKCSIATDE